MTTATLQVSTPSDREVAMTRVFDAPRRLVFDAFTKPELIKRWLGVREGWTMSVCEVDLTVGGAYRYEWRGPKGEDLGMGGVYREITRPDRIVCTERFDAPFDQGEAIDTTVWMEQDGKTTVTITVLAPSREVRDAVLKSGMTTGVEQGYETLDRVLASIAQQTA
jgi:uncharacterized protein YndB with AHSA1/START domain